MTEPQHGAIPGVAWAKAPVDLLTSDLSDKAVRVYLLLRSYGNESDPETRIFPSQETLAERLGYSVSSVERAIRELKETGWIVVMKEPCHKGFRNLYQIQDHPSQVKGAPRHPSWLKGGTPSQVKGGTPSQVTDDIEPIEPDPYDPEKKGACVTVRRGSYNDASFDEIWERWPNQKTGRQRAFNAWKSLLRERAASKNDIIAACVIYLEHQTGNDYAMGLPKFLGDRFTPGDWVDWIEGAPTWASTKHIEDQADDAEFEAAQAKVYAEYPHLNPRRDDEKEQS